MPHRIMERAARVRLGAPVAPQVDFDLDLNLCLALVSTRICIIYEDYYIITPMFLSHSLYRHENSTREGLNTPTCQ